MARKRYHSKPFLDMPLLSSGCLVFYLGLKGVGGHLHQGFSHASRLEQFDNVVKLENNANLENSNNALLYDLHILCRHRSRIKCILNILILILFWKMLVLLLFRLNILKNDNN